LAGAEDAVMARISLTRTLSGFTPADESSKELTRKYKVGEVYKADVVKPRSYAFHKLAFALLNLTYENQDRYANFEHFRKAVAIAAGHVEELIRLDGEIVYMPKSISYDALDQVQFEPVFAAMMTVCCEILKVEAPILEAEVSRYADSHYGRAA
jgi:hypothetical protein